MQNQKQNTRKKPDWLKIRLPQKSTYANVHNSITKKGLNTICTSGKCPNLGECWDNGTATIMILGDICTRACRFCAVKTGKPLDVDRSEPQKTAESVRTLGLKHCVITSVDRDDLPDGGASIWAETITAIKELNPQTTTETLIPDFDGNTQLIDIVIKAGPEIISHNIETTERLTPQIRSKAEYRRSLAVLKHIAGSGTKAKSGIMVGLGESYDEILTTISDIRATGCSIITIGQYLQPTRSHAEVVEYIHPDTFKKWKEFALEIGFEHAESSPLTRSSYHAEKHI